MNGLCLGGKVDGPGGAMQLQGQGTGWVGLLQRR